MKSVRELHDDLSAELLSFSNLVTANAGNLDTSQEFRSELRTIDEKIIQLSDALNEEIPISSQVSKNVFSIRIRSAITEINGYIDQMHNRNSAITDLRELLNFPKNFLESENSPKLTQQTLTKREREILALLPKGATAKAMASELFLTEATIKTHLASIYRKFEVVNRTQAIAIGLENKLISF